MGPYLNKIIKILFLFVIQYTIYQSTTQKNYSSILVNFHCKIIIRKEIIKSNEKINYFK